MSFDQNTRHWILAKRVADQYCGFPQVEGIAMGGSQASGVTDSDSDIDLYVFITKMIPLEQRVSIVEKLGASRADMGLDFWDIGDEWFDEETGIEVDLMLWDTKWIEDQVDRSVVHHQAGTGYSTCFWHTMKNARILFDRSGWLEKLVSKCDIPYPDELVKAVLKKNYPALRNVIPAYLNQIEKAVKRNDLVSVNHRVAALLASYFDILFAINRLPNPGEKKLLKIAKETCRSLPHDMEAQVESLLRAASTCSDVVVDAVHVLVDHLDTLLVEEGYSDWVK